MGFLNRIFKNKSVIEIQHKKTDGFGHVVYEIGRSIHNKSLNPSLEQIPCLEQTFDVMKDIIFEEFNAIEDYLNGISSQHENATKGCVSYVAIKLGYENKSPIADSEAKVDQLETLIRDRALTLHTVMKNKREIFIMKNKNFMNDVKKGLDFLQTQNTVALAEQTACPKCNSKDTTCGLMTIETCPYTTGRSGQYEYDCQDCGNNFYPKYYWQQNIKNKI